MHLSDYDSISSITLHNAIVLTKINLNAWLWQLGKSSKIKEWFNGVMSMYDGYTSVSRQWTFLCHVREWPCLTFDLSLAISWWPKFISVPFGKDSRTMSGGRSCPFAWPLVSSFSLLTSAMSLTPLVTTLFTSGSSFLTPAAVVSALNSIDPSSECSCSSWWLAKSSMRLR